MVVMVTIRAVNIGHPGRLEASGGEAERGGGPGEATAEAAGGLERLELGGEERARERSPNSNIVWKARRTTSSPARQSSWTAGIRPILRRSFATAEAGILPPAAR